MTWALSRSTLDVRMFCVVEQDYLEMQIWRIVHDSIALDSGHIASRAAPFLGSWFSGDERQINKCQTPSTSVLDTESKMTQLTDLISSDNLDDPVPILAHKATAYGLVISSLVWCLARAYQYTLRLGVLELDDDQDTRYCIRSRD